MKSPTFYKGIMPYQMSFLLHHICSASIKHTMQNSRYCDVLTTAQKSTAQLLLDTIPPPPAASAPMLPSRSPKGSKKPDAPPQQPPTPAYAAWERRRRVMHSELIRLERTHFMLSGCLRTMLAVKAMGEWLLFENGDLDIFTTKGLFHRYSKSPFNFNYVVLNKSLASKIGPD